VFSGAGNGGIIQRKDILTFLFQVVAEVGFVVFTGSSAPGKPLARAKKQPANRGQSSNVWLRTEDGLREGNVI
jgi:hypothetical protein